MYNKISSNGIDKSPKNDRYTGYGKRRINMGTETKKITLLERLTDFIENKLAPPLIRISQVRYLQTLQRTFMVMMPYMILGATATLILNLGG